MMNLKIILTLFLCSQVGIAQNQKVHGVVKDSTGILLAGVNILIEGTPIFTTTNFDGNYTIKASSGNVLVFSYVGMKSQKRNANKDEINVTLQAEDIIKDLIPYTIPQKKPKYATTQVMAEELKSNNNPNYQFRKNAKENLFVVYILDFVHLEKADFEFQKKYKIFYSSPQNYGSEYVKKYNILTFKYLTRIYKKEWQSRVRQDATGIDDYLK